MIKYLTIFLFCLPVTAKKLHHEAWYQEYQCNKLGGITEYHPKKDRWVRIDCELTNYSVEIDFSSSKQYEAIGQSLYYSALTGKKAGVWLIVENPKDMKHAIRMVRNIRMNNLPITVWLQRATSTYPTFEIYYQPKTIISRFEKLMKYGNELKGATP